MRIFSETSKCSSFLHSPKIGLSTNITNSNIPNTSPLNRKKSRLDWLFCFHKNQLKYVFFTKWIENLPYSLAVQPFFSAWKQQWILYKLISKVENIHVIHFSWSIVIWIALFIRYNEMNDAAHLLILIYWNVTNENRCFWLELQK